MISAVVQARMDERAVFAIRDLSAAGARLVGQLRLAEGEQIKVELEIEGSKISLAATVVRTDPQTSQIAVAFRDVAPEAAQQIDGVVAAELGALRAQSQATVLLVHPPGETCDALERDLARLGLAATVCGSLADATWRLADRAVRHEAVLVSAELDAAAVIHYAAEQYATLRRVVVFGEQVRSLDHATSSRVHAILRTPWHLRGLARALEVQQPALRTYDMLTAVSLDDET